MGRGVRRMFRLIRLKPPHGWNAVAWELGIVTLGVIIALAAQQWANNRAQRSQMDKSETALREEVAEHYNYAVEFRVVHPCLQAQLDGLRQRVMSSGAVINPAPVYSEETSRFVLRMPSKIYPTDAWQAAISDGTIQSFPLSMRRELAGYYGQLSEVDRMNADNNAAEEGLVTIARPLPLDASVRYAIVKDIDQIRGRLEYLDLINGQIIDSIQKVHMVPPAAKAQEVTERYGSYQFCTAHKLPMRSFKDAMEAVPN